MTIEELAAAISAGDEARAGELWEQCRGFIYQQARRYLERNSAVARCELEDLTQAGYFAIIDAARTYDPETGCKFLTWLDYFLLNHFRECAQLRTTRERAEAIQESNALRIEAPVGNDTDDLTIADTISDPRAEDEFIAAEERIYTQELHNQLEKHIDASLTDNQADIIRRRYWKAETRKEIAGEINKSPDQVKQTELTSIDKMRRNINTRSGQGLKEYIDQITDFFSGVSLGSFITFQSSQPERLTLNRADWEKKSRRE